MQAFTWTCGEWQALTLAGRGKTGEVTGLLCPLLRPLAYRDLDTVESVRQKLGELTDLHGLRR